MARKDIDERVAEIDKRSQELEVERKKLLERKSQQQRKDDTRRKILAGAIVLGDEQLKKAVTWKLAGTLKADRDRVLFGLPLLPKKATAATTSAPATARRSGDQPGGGNA